MGEAPRPADAVKALEAEIRRHNRLYWDTHSPEITDYEYDALVRKLKALSPDSPVLTEMGPSAPGGDASRAGTEFRHKERMLSLDKCYAAEDLAAWAGTFEGKVVVTPKFDGIACALHYDEQGRLAVAATRGDGEVGEDITANAREIKDIPGRVKSGGRAIEVRGEIYMRLSVFARFQAEGKSNPRNLAAGAIKQKDARKSAAYELSFAAYDLLGVVEPTQEAELARLVKLGFPKVDSLVLPREEALRGYEEFARLRPTLDYEIDGVVFKANELAEQRRLGETSHHPRHSLAYKFQGDSGISTLREVEWSVARSGAITPVAIVDPVGLSGVSVSRASLHNVAFIAKLGLTIGAKVTLVRRGGVIPNVEGVVEPGTEPVVVPKRCPSCHKAVVREKDFLYCTEPRGCRSAVIGRLSHFAATCDILGFGDAILEQCYDAGLLRSPADFYALEWQQLAGLERSGEKMGKKLVAEVDRKRTLDLATFLRALGVAELGKHVSALLADRYATLDAVLAISEEELVGTHGIGETIAHSVVAGLAEERATIDALREHVTVTETRPAAAGEKPFAGKSFVFTGKLMTLARSEAEQRVRALGGAVLSAVSKSVAYLVLGQEKDGGKSTKQKAAEKLVAAGEAIKVLSEAELLAMLEAAEASVRATSGASAGSGSGARAGAGEKKKGQGDSVPVIRPAARPPPGTCGGSPSTVSLLRADRDGLAGRRRRRCRRRYRDRRRSRRRCRLRCRGRGVRLGLRVPLLRDRRLSGRRPLRVEHLRQPEVLLGQRGVLRDRVQEQRLQLVEERKRVLPRHGVLCLGVLVPRLRRVAHGAPLGAERQSGRDGCCRRRGRPEHRRVVGEPLKVRDDRARRPELPRARTEAEEVAVVGNNESGRHGRDVAVRRRADHAGERGRASGRRHDRRRRRRGRGHHRHRAGGDGTAPR